jgi:hypothetical protein
MEDERTAESSRSRGTLRILGGSGRLERDGDSAELIVHNAIKESHALAEEDGCDTLIACSLITQNGAR